jgi:hypothetical protein
MRHFYDSLADGRSVGGSVREAKTRMIRSRYRHPFYWAAFGLIGCAQGSYSIVNSREAEANSLPVSSTATTVQR